MDEEITIDTVGPSVASHLCINGTTDVVLLMEQVIELNAEGSALVEEGLRQLEIPY